MQLPLLKNANVKGKTVFLRADLDVPTKSQKSKVPTSLKLRGASKSQKVIEDDSRLRAALPTIEYLLKNNAKVIIGGHLGRPKPIQNSKFRIQNSNGEFSLEPIARWFAGRLKIKNLKFTKLGEFDGWHITENLYLLENLRFYEGEEKNDPEFAKKLATLADIYVNDAFAVCHRSHASIVGISKFLPHFAGFHLEQEITHLNSALQNPKRPLAVIVGGKKIETKLPLVIKMYDIADYVLVGGKIAEESKEFIKAEHQKSKSKALLLIADLNIDRTGILENSIVNFIEVINRSKTIIWNGSMGKIDQRSKVPTSLKLRGASKSQKSEEDDFNHASKRIARAIIESKAYSVIGGGDTTEFLRRIGLINKFNFVSTGGGAMLAFLSGEKLPGIEILEIK